MALDEGPAVCEALCGGGDASVVAARLGVGSTEKRAGLGEREADGVRTSTSPSERTLLSGIDEEDGEDMR